MFNLHLCWILFALIFIVESFISFYLDIIGIPMMVAEVEQEDQTEFSKNLTTGINIKHMVKIVLQQSLIFVTYKTVEYIVLTLK